MTRLVLVRHGQTVWHQGNRYAGRSDIALDDVGHTQAKSLASWAASAELAAIWCSPLARAQITAQACAEATGLTERVDDRLRELDFGNAEGLMSHEIRARFPKEFAAFTRAPATNHLPGGEEPRLLVERFVECLQDITRAHPGARVLVVAHTTAIRLVLCALIGVSLDDYRRVFPFVRNCGLTEISLEGETAAVHQFNTPVDQPGVDTWPPASLPQATSSS